MILQISVKAFREYVINITVFGNPTNFAKGMLYSICYINKECIKKLSQQLTYVIFQGNNRS